VKLEEIRFERPRDLDATRPPEERGIPRDGVRLLVSSPAGDTHAQFRDLLGILRSGDLVVVNESATVPAAIPARASFGDFLLHLSTRYSSQLWLAEPRWSPSRPGPLPLEAGAAFEVAGVEARVIAPYPGLPRLLFVGFDQPIASRIAEHGRPIRYSYLARDYPLETYQTVFAAVPGSAEMASAGRPFSHELVDRLLGAGVRFARIVLHAGVSSMEVTSSVVESHPISPEPFHVPAETIAAIEATRCARGRVIAVGTTVARALESAWDGKRLLPSSGFTRLFLHPGRVPRTFDALLTGFHDPETTHLALLYAVAGGGTIRRAYGTAVRGEYLWHEFGDSHLIFRTSN
jgi:S-adenosylmethionine:tRNA ribosyltransferase-isomerase